MIGGLIRNHVAPRRGLVQRDHVASPGPLVSLSQRFGRSLSCDMSFGYVGQSAEPRLSINRRAILPSEMVVSG